MIRCYVVHVSGIQGDNKSKQQNAIILLIAVVWCSSISAVTDMIPSQIQHMDSPSSSSNAHICEKKYILIVKWSALHICIRDYFFVILWLTA